jgi:beta-phosphoglucomutase-like phosphatase (HAD superfamily)
MTSGQTQFAALDAVVRQARHLLIAFDGPICTLFAETPAASVAEQLRQPITKEGVPFPQLVETTADPLDILRFAASLGDHLASRVEAQLTDLESAAVTAALVTPHIHDVLNACRESGRSAAVISASSSAAVHAYLYARDLTGQITAVAARTSTDPAFFPPSPHLVDQAASTLGASPAECVVIASTPRDVQAARTTGAPSIGYAKTPHDAEHLIGVGASVVVYSMADLALSFRARASDWASDWDL